MTIGGRIQPLDSEASLRAILPRWLPVAATGRELFGLLAARMTCMVMAGQHDMSAHAVCVTKTTLTADGATLVFGTGGVVLTEGVIYGGTLVRGGASGVVRVATSDGAPSRMFGVTIRTGSGESVIVDGVLLMVGCVVDGSVRVGSTGKLAAVGCKIDGGFVVDPGGVLSQAGNL